MSLGANGAGRCGAYLATTVPLSLATLRSREIVFSFFFSLLLLLKTLKIFFQFSVTHFPIKTNEIVRGPAESVEIPTIQQLTLFGRMSSGKKKDRERERERESTNACVGFDVCRYPTHGIVGLAGR